MVGKPRLGFRANASVTVTVCKISDILQALEVQGIQATREVLEVAVMTVRHMAHVGVQAELEYLEITKDNLADAGLFEKRPRQ